MDKQPNPAESNAAKKAPNTKTLAEAPRAKAPTPWIFLGGLALVAGGVGLALLPRVSRDLGWITNNFAKNGIFGAQLALTGAVVCAIGLASRSRRSETKSEAADDKSLILDQLASDMALSRGTMQDLRVEFVYLKDAVHKAATQAELLAQNQTGEDATQSAIFRLAASIDQLAGQTDQRAKAFEAALGEQGKTLRAEIARTAACVGDLRTELAQAMAEGGGSGGAHGELTWHPDEERQIEIAEGYQPSENDLHVLVEMEEPASSGLGLLDEFDDHGSHVSNATTRSNARGTTIDDIPGPLPASRALTMHAPIDEKMAALRQLMADPAVRRALESARNGVH